MGIYGTSNDDLAYDIYVIMVLVVGLNHSNMKLLLKSNNLSELLMTDRSIHMKWFEHFQQVALTSRCN